MKVRGQGHDTKSYIMPLGSWFRKFALNYMYKKYQEKLTLRISFRENNKKIRPIGHIAHLSNSSHNSYQLSFRESNTKYLVNSVEKTLYKEIFKFFYTYSYDIETLLLFQFLRGNFFSRFFSISSYVKDLTSIFWPHLTSWDHD